MAVGSESMRIREELEVPVWPRPVSVLVVGILAIAACGPETSSPPEPEGSGVLHRLPDVAEDHAPGSLEDAIASRRSLRDFAERPLTDGDVGQLLWAAQGITDPTPDERRAAPSAGGTYPLEVYAVSADGVARYLPRGHALEPHLDTDRRRSLAAAALGQDWIADAPLVLVVTGVIERTSERYGDHALRFVLLEAGHAAQNVLLQAVGLGLGAVPVGAFHEEAVTEALRLPDDHAPLYLIPVGHPEP